MSTRIRKSAKERKSEIIEASLSLSADVGPGCVTTEALAKFIGLSHGAVFRHFPTKADIWTAVFAYISQKMQQGWDDIESSKTSVERIQKLIRAQLSLVESMPALPSIIFSRELHQGNPELKKGIMGMMKRFHTMLSDEIQTGITSGELSPYILPNEGANMIIATLQGTILRWSLAKKKFSLIAEGEKMLGLVMRALQNP